MLHYTEHISKNAKEWVVFVHGAGGSSSIWFKQIRAFKARFNVLLIDLRGHGKSKNPLYNRLKEYSFPVIGDEVIEVIDHLKIQQAHFVGISLGTIIIRDLAERHPERVSSQILGGAVMKLNTRGQILMRMGNSLKSVIPYLILYKLFAWVIMPKKSHRASRNLFVREAKKLYQNEFKRWFTLAAEVNPLLKFFRSQPTSIPTLYVMGSEDHMFLPSIRKLVEDHKEAILHVIPRCGHVVNVEQADQFNAISLSFLTDMRRPTYA